MSIIIKFAEDRLVEVDIREITAEEAESSDATLVDRTPTEEVSEESTGGRRGRRIPRLLAVGGLAVGAAYAARKLRGGRGKSISEEVTIETEKTEAEN